MKTTQGDDDVSSYSCKSLCGISSINHLQSAEFSRILQPLMPKVQNLVDLPHRPQMQLIQWINMLRGMIWELLDECPLEHTCEFQRIGETLPVNIYGITWKNEMIHRLISTSEWEKSIHKLCVDGYDGYLRSIVNKISKRATNG